MSVWITGKISIVFGLKYVNCVCSEHESEIEGLAPTKEKEQLVQFRKASNHKDKSKDKLFHKSVALDSSYDLNFKILHLAVLQ